MANPCANRARRDSTNESPLPVYPDLAPQIRDILPNLKRLASRYASREDWLTFDDAIQTLLLGAHIGLQKLDPFMNAREQGRYLAIRSENFLKTRIDLDSQVSCRSQVTAARNRVRSGIGTENDADSVGFLAYSRTTIGDLDVFNAPWQCSPIGQPEDEAMVSWALAQLPPLDAAVFELVKLLKFSYQEAAEILKVSVDRVQSRLKAGGKMLAGLFAETQANTEPV